MIPYRHTVQYYETDKMQVTHHSNYIRFMEEARVYYLAEMGWPYDKMEAEGIISPVVSISCDYKKPTAFADEIEIELKVSEVSRAKMKFQYIMTVGDTVVCTAESLHCFVSEEGRPISIQKQYPEFYSTLAALTE